MKKFSKYSLFSALILVLLTTACGADQGASPTTVGTILPPGSDMTSTPSGSLATAVGTAENALGSETPALGLETATTTAGLESPTAGVATQSLGLGTQTPVVGTPRTAVVPVTGQDIMLVECQFCVDTRAHALLVLPDTATFQISSPAATSNTTVDTQPTCTTVEINNGRQVVLCSGPEMTPLVVNICTDASNCSDFPVDLLACPLTPGGTVNPATTQAPGTGGTGGVEATASPLGGIAGTATITP